jgi:translation initiation factor IF-2
MTDTNTSGASFAPAADTSAPAASAETPAAKFGSTRGSGLIRGKRFTSAAAPTGTPAKADYKPTSLEVITPASEYKNPFASPEPENPPAAEPAKVEIKAEEPAPIAAEPIAVEPIAADVMPVADQPPIEREEINILPPAEAVRPAVSWESPSASHTDSPPAADEVSRDERPTFRPDRREDQPGAPRTEQRNDGFQRQPRDPRFARQPRDPREARQPRDPREARQPRDPRDERQPRDPRDERPRYEQRPQRDHNGAASHAAPAPKGFFGWLKSLFAGPKPAEAAPSREIAPEGGYGDGQRHRRRHRGGRGHGGGAQGFRPEGGVQQSSEGGDRENRGGERHGGPRRRRHRGGAGRDRGGNYRSEGSQGGGAI